MKQLLLPSTTKFLLILVFIIAISDAAKAASNRGVKAVILYTYDDSTTGSSVVTMEVDKNKFMSVIQDTQSNVKDARPLKFIQNNGFFDLLEGDSSQFSFMTTNGMADCDCKCLRRPVITTRTTTTKKPDCPNGGRAPYCCANGANNPDCCANNGKGPYCCTNGADNPDCCVNGGRGKFCCTNGASNPDCCANNGKGPYCCTNGANNPNCELPTRATPPPFVSKKDVAVSTAAPTYLPPTTTTTLSPCPIGGSGPYCCPNGANNIDCCQNGGRGPHCCLNGANNPDCCANGGEGPNCCTNGGRGKYCCTNGVEDNPDCTKYVAPTTTRAPAVYTTTTRAPPVVFTTTTTRPQITTTTTTKKPECSNGGRAPYCCENGASNKDCCLNNGKGQFCCTNGANNPNCELPTRAPPPAIVTKKDVFRGPTYLPVARVTTERPSTTTQTYTYGSRPTFTYRFSFTNGAWTYVPRSTSYTTRATTTTAKYAYDQPSNGINYSGADNAL